jgi:outer membrane receptor protein involved in Fe transport
MTATMRGSRIDEKNSTIALVFFGILNVANGNPNLRPELAFGMDAAWERYFGKDNLASVGTYVKRIRETATPGPRS